MGTQTVLSIGKLVKGQEAYYLGKVAQGIEDYYAGDGEAAGRWAGAGAAELGLEGNVSAEELRLMLAGHNPADGEPLRDRPGNSGTGFDLTFSAPKSVSLVWAFGDAEARRQVVAAHEGAINSALGYLEENAMLARRGKGGHRFLKAPHLLAAAYRHRLSRAGDPQIHTHVLISQLVKATDDGRWTSLYSPSLFAQAKTAGFLYQAELRDRLTRRLGLDWTEVTRGTAEVVGIEEPARAVFSRRRAEIEAAQAAQGTGTAKSFQATVLATRKSKPAAMSGRELEDDWGERAREVGLDLATIEHLVRPGREPGRPEVMAASLARRLTENRSHFTRKDVIQAVCEQLPEGGHVAQVEAAADWFLESEHAVMVGQAGWGATYTTPEILDLERGFIRATEQGMDAGVATVPTRQVQHVLSERQIDETAEQLEPDVELRRVISQQRDMVQALTQGGHRIAVVSGVAGAGKTWALAAAHEAWKAEGVAVIGACASWRAADVLTAESGVPAQSITSLLHACRQAEAAGHPALPKGAVLVVDEAAMASTRDLAQLCEHVKRVEGKLVLIGDYDQLQPVGAGGLFRAVYERHGVASLPHSRRQQRLVDRRVVELIANGHGAQALDILHSRGRVTVARTAQERDEALVADWWQVAREGADAVIIARTNLQSRDLNRIVRQTIKAAGVLGEAEVEAHGHQFAAGDVVVTRVNERQAGVRNLQRWQVTDADPTRRELRLRRLGDEHEVILGADYLDATTRHGQPALQHAYCVTAHVAQGSTHDRVLVQADTGIDRQWINTALSRAKEEMRIYAVVGTEPVIAETGPTAATIGWDSLIGSVSVDRAETSAVDEKLRAGIASKSQSELTARLRLLNRIAATTDSPTDQSKTLDSDEGLPRFLPEHCAETRLIERELSERRRAQVTADRIDPPLYIQNEIGVPPQEPVSASAWTRACDLIERHRQIWGINDRHKTFGDRATHPDRQADEPKTRLHLERLKREIDSALPQQLTKPLPRSTPFEKRWMKDQPHLERETGGLSIDP